MRRTLLLLVIMLLAVIQSKAEVKLSNSAKSYIDRYADVELALRGIQTSNGRNVTAPEGRSVRQGRSRIMQIAPRIKNGEYKVSALVSVIENSNAIEEIKARGYKVCGVYGDVVSVEANVSAISQLASIEGVSRVSLTHNRRLLSDAQRATSNVDAVWLGTGLDVPYTGKNVVVGVVDMGIDYNHLAFCDSEGKSRVVRVYQPDDNKIIKIGDKEIPGVEYATPEAIAKLTTDYDGESHGTHTSAIAVATKIGAYSGMAPECDVVLCGLGEDLSDPALLNAIDYVFTYAESVGKPAVVNLSIGDHIGAHDGTSEICRAMDALSGDGRVIVAAVGNEGDILMHFSTKFANVGSSVEQKAVVLTDYDFGGGFYESLIDIWGKNDTSFTFQYVVVDGNGKILARSKQQQPGSDGSCWFDMSSHTTFKNYYTGEGTAYFGVDSNNDKYNIFLDIQAESTGGDNDWRLGLLFWGPDGVELNGWDADGYTDFVKWDNNDFISGDTDMSVSSMATGKEVISVGAFASKTSYTAIDGKNYSYLSLRENDIVSFSSYGPDANGIARPDVVGAGATVVSAVNRYDIGTVGGSAHNVLAAEVTGPNEEKYHWGDMMGSSMSSPQVAGIIALWLQANGMLNAEDVREIFNKTAIKDNFVTDGDARRWGAGKIDALNGIKYVIGATGIDDINLPHSPIMIDATEEGGMMTIYAPNEKHLRIFVYSIDGGLCREVVANVECGMAQCDVLAGLDGGMYVVKVEGEKWNATEKIVVR